MADRRLRVGVVFGGRSGEHEVSLAGAASVMAAIDRARFERRAHRHRQGRALARRRRSAPRAGPGRPRGSRWRRAGRRPRPSASCSTRAAAGEATSALARMESSEGLPAGLREQPRRGAGHAPRPPGRGRDHPGTARAGGPAVHGRGRPRLGHRHGQGGDEGRLPGPRAADRGARARQAPRVAARPQARWSGWSPASSASPAS